MAREHKPTAKQVFKRHLEVKKIRLMLLGKEASLRELLKKSGSIDEVIEHDGIVYRLYWDGFGHHELKIDRLGSAKHLASLLGVHL